MIFKTQNHFGIGHIPGMNILLLLRYFVFWLVCFVVSTNPYLTVVSSDCAMFEASRNVLDISKVLVALLVWIEFKGKLNSFWSINLKSICCKLAEVVTAPSKEFTFSNLLGSGLVYFGLDLDNMVGLWTTESIIIKVLISIHKHQTSNFIIHNDIL